MSRGRFWSWLGLAALGLVFYGILLLVFLPAEYFSRGVTLLSRGAVIIRQPSGTFWQGSGELARVRTSPQPVGLVQWTFHPWRLVTGSVVAELQLNDSDTEARGTVEIGMRGCAFRDVAAVAPMRVVALFYPMVEILGLDGRFRLTTTTFEINRDALQGSAELLWENATSRLLPVAQSGSYKLSVTGQGPRADLQLSTVQGELQVAGVGEWRLLDDGVFRFQGTVTATRSQPTLDAFLNYIAPAQADGRRSFAYETRLPPIQPISLFSL